MRVVAGARIPDATVLNSGGISESVLPASLIPTNTS